MGTHRHGAAGRATPAPGLVAVLTLAAAVLGACATGPAGTPVEVAGTTLDGATLTLADGDGPVVVNFQ